MDITREIINTNPRERANCLSVLFFSYTIGLFVKGYKKTLEIEDLYNPLEVDRSKRLGDRLEKKWHAHLTKTSKLSKQTSLLKVLGKTFWPEYLYLGVIIFMLEIVFRLMQPLMLCELLDYFRPSSPKTKQEALYYAAAVVILNGGIALLTNQYTQGAFHYALKVRTACCTLVYRKSLKLSRCALGDSTSGKVVNLLSNDVSRFEIFSYLVHYMWVGPVSAIIVAYFLYAKAGYAGIIGMVPIFLIVPLQSYIGVLSARYRRKTAYRTDERIRLMDEIISGVQVIKMYAWEIPFAKIISMARHLELQKFRKLSYVRGLYMAFNLFTTRAALFSTLITITLTNQEISVATVFAFMYFFNIFSNTMSAMFVRGMSEIPEALVSIKRIEQFLLYKEFKEIVRESNIDSDVAVGLHKVTAKWNENLDESALNGVDLTVKKGTLLGIIGPVGCSKSSLLQTILGELYIENGKMEINGTISYASQEAWVFASTVRQNILFGEPYDRRRYNEVVKVCALETDFKQFPNGDLSLVGERGASLSGGQKARINLARAVYRKADIYLLDDPLSAVDVPVAKHLYKKCINGYLANKTRILVTHQVHHLKDADNIIVINNGMLEIQGTFAELAASDHFYAKILKYEPESEEFKTESARMQRRISMSSRIESIASSMNDIATLEGSSIDLSNKENELQMKNLQEESSKGKVKGSLFFKYLLAGGGYFFVLSVVMLYLLAQVAASSTDYFVSFWVKVEEKRKGNSDAYEEKQYYINIYIGLIVSVFIIALTRSLCFYILATSCSYNLHSSMFNSIINTDMHFFDTNPSGRILNRFSKDIGGVDEQLPKVILDANQMILLTLGAVTLVAITNPYFLIPIALIGCLFLLLRKVMLKSSKNIKRLEGITRSPVFTHLNATLQGLTTIRAFNAADILKAEFDKHQDLYSSSTYMYLTISCAFGFCLDILSFIFTLIVTFTFIAFTDGTNGSDVGLAITQASTLTGMVQWGVRQSAEIANQLMSVERIFEYIQLIPEKQPLVPKNPSSNWPQEGNISFKDMSLRYWGNSELTLKHLDITIKPKEKIGIVGRTGAGKSSLIAALFRLANVEGGIDIDGIDTKDIQLQLLRSKISIIPQDPVLFSGTLRYNLDPFEEFSDHTLYDALQKVELKDPANLINKLEYRVMDRGANYSVGQRQLICLARAIVRSNKILMLDEATANVDPQTDCVIQKTIREQFADCTVLTVAHRLNTIMDSDRVLVMDGGKVVEFDHPHNLLTSNKGIFCGMVKDTGNVMMEQLKTVACQSYQRKFSVTE